MRLEPHAIGALARAPGPRQRGHLGHERQDDDGGDGRRDPRARRARASCTTAPARTWRAASRRRCWRRPAAAGGSTATPASSRSTSSGSGQRRRRARAARAAAGQPLPRPARPLRRARRRSPTAGRPWSPRRPPRASCSTPTTRRSPTSGRDRADALYFGVEDDSMALDGHAARRRLQALPPLRRALPLRGDLPRPPRPLPLPTLRRRRARSRPSPRPTSCSTASAAPRSRCARPPATPRRAAPPRALQRLQRARRRPRSALALGAPLDDVVGGAGGRRARVRPRGDAATSAAATCRSCSSRTPPAPTRSCARSSLEPGEHDLLGVLNDRIADGRDVSWVWDADFEVLARARAPRRPAAAPAPPRWRCG